MSNFSHIDDQGTPLMVDTGAKKVTKRTAIAQSIVEVGDAVYDKLHELGFSTPKGSIFQTAILAGIMAAKKTGDLIPLCHPIGMDHCTVTIQVNEKKQLCIQCKTEVEAKTGIEMEALVGASLAALTIYDMCKALSHDIRIVETRLIQKTGGKKDYFYSNPDK